MKLIIDKNRDWPIWKNVSPRPNWESFSQWSQNAQADQCTESEAHQTPFSCEKKKNPTHWLTVPAAAMRSLPLMSHLQRTCAKLYMEHPLRITKCIRNQKYILYAVKWLLLQSARNRLHSMQRTTAQLWALQVELCLSGKMLPCSFPPFCSVYPRACGLQKLASLFFCCCFFPPCPARYCLPKVLWPRLQWRSLQQKALPSRDIWREIDCRADGKSQTAGDTGGDYREAEKESGYNTSGRQILFYLQKLFRNGEKQPLSPTETHALSFFSINHYRRAALNLVFQFYLFIFISARGSSSPLFPVLGVPGGGGVLRGWDGGAGA